MSQSLDIIGISLLVFALLRSVLVTSSAKCQWNAITLTVPVSLFGNMSYALAHIGLLAGFLSLSQIQRVFSIVLPFCLGVLTVQVGFLAMREIKKKKITTLWKTPVLGALAGNFLEFKFAPLIGIGFLAISLYVLAKDSENYRYLIKKTLWILPGLVPLYFVTPDQIYLIPLSLAWIQSSTNVFNNSIFASNLFKKVGREEN